MGGTGRARRARSTSTPRSSCSPTEVASARLLQTRASARAFSPRNRHLRGDALVQFHLIYQSPIVRIARWTCDGHSRTPGEPAWSQAPTFAFLLHGLFRRHLGRAEVLGAPGDALFFPGETEYRTSHPQNGGDHGIALRVDQGTVEEILGRAGHRKAEPDGLVRSRALVPPRAVLRLRRLVDTLEDDQAEALDVDETALLLLGRAAGGMVESGGGYAGRAATRRAHRQAVERIMEMVQARLHERLRLEEIAREAAYSPYHLCRVFRDQTGMTIHGYVNRQRLLRALELLGTEENLARLAARLGFASHSHLTLACKRNLGRPPSCL